MANEFKIKNGYLSEGNSQVTGSLIVTGSLTTVGPTTSTQIGAGASPSGSVPLDVRAQGTLATDIALRVRNSADDRNNFQIDGLGAATFRSNQFYNGIDLFTGGGSQLALRTYGNVGMIGTDGNGTINFNSTLASIGYGNYVTPLARLDVKAQGALSTDIAFRVRNSANTANLGAIYGNGTVNLGNSNFDFQSTETSGRTAVIGSSNTGASYNTYSILSILGHNNNIIGYGHTSYVGINSSINQNSGGTVTGMGESNTLVGGTIGIGMNNNIAGSANGNMNTGIGYNNAIQYEKTNTFLLGNNLRVSAAGAASMTKIGWANSAGTLAQIDRSFEVYLNGQSGSDFHVTGKTNVVLKNNSVLVSGTNYEAAATNTLTIHNGVAPTTNITGAFQLYSSASSATILGSLVVNQTATTQSLNTSTRTLFDSSSRSSVSWDNRGLIDSDVTTSINWGSRVAYDIVSNLSIDWNTRVLYTPNDSNNALNWANDNFLGSNVYQRDYKTSVLQNAVSNTYNDPEASYLGDVIEVDGNTITIDATVTDGMLVYLDDSTDSWLPVDQTTVVAQLLGIAHNVSAGTGYILLEGHVVVDDMSTSGPCVEGANQGGAVYIKQGTGAGVMNTTKPTTGTNDQVMGHCYYKNIGTATQWMMKFRPIYKG